MSIKDLFNNKGIPKIQKSTTSDELVSTVESSKFLNAKQDQFDQFIPPIDFLTASNFAKFGSAELYYEKAFERIHNYYPYDGTLHEKIQFENSSSYLDKHVLENIYPRTNGYLNFKNNIYISVFGGLHTASGGMTGKTFDSTFDHSVKYDESKKRTSAFEFRGLDGITAEFWLKPAAINTNYNILHITGNLAGELMIEQENQNLKLTMNSGSATTLASVFTSIVPDTEWNYYAITLVSSSVGLTSKAYRNGQLFGENNVSTIDMPHILPQSGGLNMRIGKRFTDVRPFSGSMDEFRFSKKAKTPEQIFNTWFVPIGGGTNKHDSNIDLSCYFKFNEGKTGNSVLDSTVLDYSGRINNGQIQGTYISSIRNTGSAIREKLNQPEFLDPIIYSSHPDVVAKKAEFKTSGSLSDLENTSMLYRYFPSWMQEEDEQNGKKLKYLSQVLASSFDTLWHQIEYVNKIHDYRYVEEGEKALPFAKKLVYDKGFVLPDLFSDATLIENLRQKDDNEIYEEEINEVRNTMYHNLYNSLDTIYKSKGTEKSFRNFFRTLGIGQDIVKLKMYADDSTFVLRNNYEYKSYGRNYLNFNVNGHSEATIYQTTSSINTNIYVPGDKNFSGSFTLQSEIILPRKQRQDEINYNPHPHLTSSIFGYHSTGSGYTHPGTDYGLQVFVVRSALESTLYPDDRQRVKFALRGAGVRLDSPWFDEQYENNKWSLAVRAKHLTYPYTNISGTTADNYLLEFYGVEADGNTKRNYFLLSTPSVGLSYYSSDKIFYAGAHRTNFKGTTLHFTDVKLGYVRYWHSLLSNDAIDQHAFDTETFGANEPFEQDLANVYSMEIPREKTLGFHWAFHDTTTSNTAGEFDVTDHSSGTVGSNYGSLSNTIQREVKARGFGFLTSSVKVVDKNFIHSARKRLPDDLMSSDLTTIKTDETEQFFVDDDVSDHFYSFEKSMWGAVSDEMMNMFSTALDLNNLIGQPNQRYHHRYNLADFLRDRFFDDVENEPDIEKFTSFYKWIDDSISIALEQLIPASTRFSSKINNVIESHVLERSKYVHQIPIATNYESTEGSIKGLAELKYNWQFGHAPTDITNESNNTLWQRERKQKSGLRETVRNSRNNHSIQSAGLIRREIDGTATISSTYATRKFAKTYDVTMVSQPTIHGGTNFGRKKNFQLFHESIAPAGRLASVPQNVITIGVGTGDGLVQEPPNNDLSPRKKKYNANARIGNRAGNEYGYNILSDFVVPMNIMSGTINSGFNKQIELSFSSGVHVTNLHNDVVGNYNEIPIQGPFTEQHVGGLQYRHIDFNTGTDNEVTRPEGWRILLKDHISAGDDGALGFVGPDYESPYPSSRFKKANRYRDEHAKRPVNVRNIKTTSTSQKVGNYRNELEIFQVSPTFQKTWAIEAYDDPNVNILPTGISSTLPDSTQYQTLIGKDANTVGNVFGVINNNRQVDGSDGHKSFAIRSPATTQAYAMTYDGGVSGYSTSGGKSFTTWINIDEVNASVKTMFYILGPASNQETLWIYAIQSGSDIRIFIRVTDSSGNLESHFWNGGTYTDFVSIWNHIVITWNGDFDDDVNGFKLYINGVSQGAPDGTSSSAGTGTTMRNIVRISLLDAYQNNNNYEFEGAMMNAAVYSSELNQSEVNQIYNNGVANDYPAVTSNLLDWWALGNDLIKPVIGNNPRDHAPLSSFQLPSVGGSAGNDLVIYSNLVIVQGVKTVSEVTRLSQLNNTITIPRTDLTGSQRNIITRFSAPGGPEVQSTGYLDAYTSTYSVHNAMPFRNLSVLGSGSGEQGTIRVEDHLGRRRGLKTLRALHMGQFGIDSEFGVITVANYPSSGSFNKQHRNTSKAHKYSSGELIITGSNHDNMHINTPIPRSEFQYSWIRAAISGSNWESGQRILGYAPRDGIVSASVGYVEAIVFPTASTIIGS